MSLLRGHDISAYQGPTAPAVDFVIVKATEGRSYTSSRFAAQWKSAKSRAKHRGAYHFARPEESTATSQAARFLDVVKPVPGESVWLDLEASDLSQTRTNAWAKTWGDYIREHAPGVTSGVYMGSGYASNGTGRDLDQHFDLWWYAQYPSAARTSTWRTTFDPWLPSGLTCGWKTPHIWQWTANLNGLDANLSTLTLDQLAGAASGDLQPAVKEAAVYGGIPPLKVGERYTRTCPKGSINIWGIAYDSTNTLTYRIAAHSKKGGGEVKADLVVGGPASTRDSWPAKQTWQTKLDDVDWFSIELVNGDPSQPDANGRVVQPGWDASHTA
ncbi:glycoside hydrolase family 25 protein [Actinoallomurus sp. CA-142502]|uniref:glycoside hydrolase family 25 protein n=1 Tax=Actinoallomurus sp. CA-142502 TaxID=3239885 RepID=UPI003D93DCBF